MEMGAMHFVNGCYFLVTGIEHAPTGGGAGEYRMIVYGYKSGTGTKTSIDVTDADFLPGPPMFSIQANGTVTAMPVEVPANGVVLREAIGCSRLSTKPVAGAGDYVWLWADEDAGNKELQVNCVAAKLYDESCRGTIILAKAAAV